MARRPIASAITAILLLAGVPAGSSAGNSARALVTRLTAQGRLIRPPARGFAVIWACNSLREGPYRNPCAGRTPGAFGKVRIDFAGPPFAAVVYTVFPDAASARAWFRGARQPEEVSLWRLKQLSIVSLPHPRLSGRVPGLASSVIVESAGHKTLDRKGVTEADVLSGNVIVNATTGSRTSIQHGNRVLALRLVRSAFAALGAARKAG
jgi:hypothetical protein